MLSHRLHTIISQLSDSTRPAHRIRHLAVTADGRTVDMGRQAAQMGAARLQITDLERGESVYGASKIAVWADTCVATLVGIFGRTPGANSGHSQPSRSAKT